MSKCEMSICSSVSLLRARQYYEHDCEGADIVPNAPCSCDEVRAVVQAFICGARHVHRPKFEEMSVQEARRGGHAKYQKNAPTLPLRRRGMSTWPGMVLERSIDETLFASVARTSQGRSSRS